MTVPLWPAIVLYVPQPALEWFFLPEDCRGHSVFVPRLSGWYEEDMTLLFVGGYYWVPLSGSFRVGREMNLIFVGRSNRGTLGRNLQGRTSHSPCCPNPSTLDFWIEFFYKFGITKILVFIVSRGRGNEFLVAILCVAIVPIGYNCAFSKRKMLQIS